MVLRNSLRRLGVVLSGCLFFTVIGVLMWIWEPSTYSMIPWSIQSQRVVGTLIIMFFGGCSFLFLWIGLRPVMLLTSIGIDDLRRNFVVEWKEIRDYQIQTNFGGQNVQWISITVHQPQKYTHILALDKKPGRIQVDIVWDLTLVSRQDFRDAQEYINSMLSVNQTHK